MAQQRQLDLEGNQADDKAAAAGGDGGKKKGRGSRGGGGDEPPTPPIDTSLAEEAQRRYLNYAVSVITSRALPDVRDGLKPVQRRILYAMYANLHLYPDAKYRKCGDHRRRRAGQVPPARRRGVLRGDGAHGAGLLAARTAGRRARQLRLARRRRAGRLPLHRGAAGAAGDGAARGDQAGHGRLPPQLRRHDARSRSCCRRSSRTCSSTAAPGIAVGMATNIPPHNLGEVCDAAVALIDDRDAGDEGSPQVHQGPRLPDRRPGHSTARRSCARSTRRGRAASACAASGRSRAGRAAAATTIVITSIPYAHLEGDAGREDRRRDHQQEAARCWSTCATSRPTTCASCSS